MWGSDTKTLKNRAGRIYVSAFHPNLYAKYNTGAGIVKLHCLRRKYLHFFPKYCFQLVTLNHKRLLLARLTLIYLAVLTPRVQCSVQHILSQIPSGSSCSFLPLPLIQRDFAGVIAPTAWGWLHPASTRENRHLPRADSNCCMHLKLQN